MSWPIVSDSFVAKWEHLFPENTRNKALLARVLENQAKCFEWMAAAWANRMPSGKVLEAIGEDWRHKVMRSIARGLNLCPLQDLVSIQPFDKPIMHVMREVSNNDSVIPFRWEPLEIRAESRKSRLRVDALPNKTPLQEFTEQVFEEDKFQQELDRVFEAYFLEELVREVMGCILNAADGTERVIHISDPLEIQAGVDRARKEIWREARWCPDYYLTSPSIAVELQDLGLPGEILVDPAFPHCKILLFTSPRTPLDCDTIYSPYYFEFDEMGNGTYALRLRHKITIVSVKGSYVVELE